MYAPRHRFLFLAVVIAVAVPQSASAQERRGAHGRAHESAHVPVETKSLPTSIVPILVGIDMGWAHRQLVERIPERLHEERNREVALGITVDLDVSRRDIALTVGGNEIRASSELVLDLSLKSRLGAFGARLGRCRATVEVSVEQPLQLGPTGTLSLPSSRANLHEPCRVGGFDLGPIIQLEVDRRLAQAQTQATQYLPQVNERLAQVYADLSERIAQPGPTCTRFLPERVIQSPVFEREGIAATWLALEGSTSDSCDSVASRRLVVTTSRVPPRFELSWSTRLSFADLAGAIQQQFAASGLKITLLKLASVRVDSIEQLAIQIRATRRPVWIYASPVARDGRVALRNLHASDAHLATKIGPVLESVSLPINTSPLDLLSSRIIELVNGTSIVLGSDRDAAIPFQLKASELDSSTEVLLDPDSLLVVLKRRMQS